jgi:hypothetical protein
MDAQLSEKQVVVLGTLERDHGAVIDAVEQAWLVLGIALGLLMRDWPRPRTQTLRLAERGGES